MSVLTDTCDKIRLWLNAGEEVYDNDLVASWIDACRERLNRDLRIADMVQIDTATALTARITVPADWLEMEYVRVVGGAPLYYKDRNSFYTPDEQGTYNNLGKYTLIGRYIEFGDSVASPGLSVEMAYFGDVPAIPGDGDPEVWLTTRYPTLVLYGSLEEACKFDVDDPRAEMWKSEAASMITKLNDNYKKSQVAGSRLSYKSARSFG